MDNKQMTTKRVTSRPLDIQAGVLAGVIAGLVFMMLEMLMVPLFLGGSPWMPPRMIAAIVMGPEILQASGFDISVMLVAVLIHMILSIIFGLIVAAIVHRQEMGAAIVGGTFFGVALYFVNFYGFTVLFEWFANARNWVSIFSHVVFGVVAAWSYRAMVTPEVETRTSRPSTTSMSQAT